MFTWVLLFTNFVPISLLVTLDFAKLFQGKFIEWDKRMIDTDHEIFTKVQSSNLNEEIGQVEYVFSDKTGTLTKNEMIFKKFTAGRRSYDFDTLIRDDPDLKELRTKSQQSFDRVRRALKLVALCHSVIKEPTQGSLNASSPDELALVVGVGQLGFSFVDRDSRNVIEIKALDSKG